MLSTPPASIRSASPARIARAALPTASMPEPHSRFIGRAGHGDRQAGEQDRHAADVAVVLARLVGAAEDQVVDLLPATRVALDQRPQRNRGEVVGANRGQRPAIAADRRPNRVADEGFRHRFLPQISRCPTLADRSVNV